MKEVSSEAIDLDHTEVKFCLWESPWLYLLLSPLLILTLAKITFHVVNYHVNQKPCFKCEGIIFHDLLSVSTTNVSNSLGHIWKFPSLMKRLCLTLNSQDLISYLLPSVIVLSIWCFIKITPSNWWVCVISWLIGSSMYWLKKNLNANHNHIWELKGWD